MHTSNREPRRFWNARLERHRDRGRCASCGAKAAFQTLDLPLCVACLDWAREGDLSDRTAR